MTDEEDAAAIGRKIKKFIAENPGTVKFCAGFLTCAVLVWVL